MADPEEHYRRWLEDEREARRLEAERDEARRLCEAALDDAGGGRAGAVTALQRLETAVERSLGFYLGHSGNDGDFLYQAFGAERARELSAALARRKLSLLTELDRVRDMRRRLETKSPDRDGPGSSPRG